MPEYVVERSSKILNRFKKPMNGSKILVLGVAYKQDIDDVRHSPALRVIEELEKEGCIVDYYDPYVENYNYRGFKKESIRELSKEILGSVDLVIITTAHTEIDYDFVQANSVFIFDTKNAMKEVKNRENIELL